MPRTTETGSDPRPETASWTTHGPNRQTKEETLFVRELRPLLRLPEQPRGAQGGRPAAGFHGTARVHRGQAHVGHWLQQRIVDAAHRGTLPAGERGRNRHRSEFDRSRAE